MSKIYYFLVFILFSITLNIVKAQTTYVPDNNFEQALIDQGIDSDGEINQQILKSDAEAVTIHLAISARNIADLTGIEAFINITELYCSHNQLTSLDLSQNIDLRELDCFNNQLTSLDVSQNTELKYLNCFNNAVFEDTSLIPPSVVIDNYEWDFGDGTSFSGLNPTHSYSTAGDYTVSLEISNTDGCISNISKTVTVYSPPAATGVFGDVPVGYWAAGWIEQLAAEGITAGCGGGNYCPESPVNRDQMAVFLVRTFNLPTVLPPTSLIWDQGNWDETDWQ